jgi:hypothetical protein
MNDLPAWLQAFAAVVALVISVWATIRATSIETRKDRLQAHGIAVAIYPELLKLKTTIDDMRSVVAALIRHDQSALAQGMAANVDGNLKIEIPSMLDRNLDRLFLLGDAAGPACLQLVTVILQHNKLVDTVTARILSMEKAQTDEALGYVEQHLILLEKVVVKCCDSVRPIHDTIKE